MSAMVVLFLVLWRISEHYKDSQEQLGVGLTDKAGVAEHFYGVSAGRPNMVIVPVEQINRAVLRTVAYARTLSEQATAVFVTDEREVGDAFRRQWEESVPDVPLTVVESPYRSLVEPLLALHRRYGPHAAGPGGDRGAAGVRSEAILASRPAQPAGCSAQERPA